jgi:hypothetical protein
MSDDCPSALEVGGYLFIFVISSGMLAYILLFWPLLAMQFGPIVYMFILAFMVLLAHSACKMYKSLFPECVL